MKRKLFCEISPLTYRISVEKNILQRKLRDLLARERFAQIRSSRLLPEVIYSHKSLIRRRLGSVDMRLQENKAVNLSLAAPRVTGVIIKPGETFSFWRLVGRDSRRKGYLDGLTISNGRVSEGTGGGMCQFTNLIHWLVLHSELTITEHHHHDGFDLFPDFGRQIPFGTGTSIMYNYLDYRFRKRHRQGISAYRVHRWGVSFHIKSHSERFVRENGTVYRCGSVVRTTVDRRSGNIISEEIIRENHARVMYDTAGLDIADEQQ